MRVHHLSCATMCPYSARLIAGEGSLFEPARLVGHCLVVESSAGLVLVDTGFGTGDVADPARLGQPFRALIRPRVDAAETLLAQLPGLGLDPADVRHIVPTHLDVDHAGGLADFPDARVHVLGAEKEAMERPPLRERGRYVPAHFAHGPRWETHAVEGDTWLGLERVRPISELDEEVALIPLVGHSRGHTGVAVKADDGWILHCGDAYFHRAEVATPPSCPPGLRLFERIVCHDDSARRRNQERLRELRRAHPDDLRTFCSHDPVELEDARSGTG